MGFIKILKAVDFAKVSDNPEVIKLIKQREQLDEKIIALDKMALVRYELEVIQTETFKPTDNEKE